MLPVGRQPLSVGVLGANVGVGVPVGTYLEACSVGVHGTNVGQTGVGHTLVTHLWPSIANSIERRFLYASVVCHVFLSHSVGSTSPRVVVPRPSLYTLNYSRRCELLSSSTL